MASFWVTLLVWRLGGEVWFTFLTQGNRSLGDGSSGFIRCDSAVNFGDEGPALCVSLAFAKL